jgi:hypothetical protein
MSKPSALAREIDRQVRLIVAEQTKARLALGFDAAILAANKTFHMGPGRAAAFGEAYNEAMQELAELYVSDCEENRDKQIDYAKGKRDEIIRKIVGEKNFVPFDRFYGLAYMDELRRIRVIQEGPNNGG